MNRRKITKLTPLDFNKYKDLFIAGGVACFPVRYEHPSAYDFSSYQTIKSDLDYCYSSLIYLEKHQYRSPGLETWAITTAMIVTYARCFTNSSMRSVGLSHKNIPFDKRQIHNKIMELRHNYIAHAGGYAEGSAGFLGLNPNHSNKRVAAVAPPIYTRTVGIDPETRNELKEIVKILTKIVEKKKIQCMSTFTQWLLSHNIEHLYTYFEKQDPAIDSPIRVPGTAYKCKHKINPDGTVNITATLVEKKAN